MTHNRLWISLMIVSVLVTSVACALPGTGRRPDLLDGTADNSRAIEEAGYPTPTAQPTPMGPIFDGGDGWPTTLIRNTTLGDLGGLDTFDIDYGEAHNFLFEAASGTSISLDFLNTPGADRAPIPTLIAPDGQTLFRLDGGPSRQHGPFYAPSAYFQLPMDGVYTLRITSHENTGYTPVLYDAVQPVYDADDGLPTSQILNIPYFFAFGSTDASQAGLLEDTTWAINYLFEAQSHVGQHPTLIRVDAQGTSQPVLSLIGPDGALLAHDDNPSGDQSARVTYTLASVDADTTTYTIRVRLKALDITTTTADHNLTLTLEWQR